MYGIKGGGDSIVFTPLLLHFYTPPLLHSYTPSLLHSSKITYEQSRTHGTGPVAEGSER